MLAQNHFVEDLAYKWKKKIKSPTTKEFIVTAWKVTLHSIHKRRRRLLLFKLNIMWLGN